MEQLSNTPQDHPASTPEQDKKHEFTVRQFTNKLQFEEAVQRLKEEVEKRPNHSSDVFY